MCWWLLLCQVQAARGGTCPRLGCVHGWCEAGECACEVGWSGSRCDRRSCPRGNDPLEERFLRSRRLRAAGEELTLTFQGQSARFASWMNSAQCSHELTSKWSRSLSRTSRCHRVDQEQNWFDFEIEMNELFEHDGNPGLSEFSCEGCSALEDVVVHDVKRHVECSGRGQCLHTGECRCDDFFSGHRCQAHDLTRPLRRLEASSPLYRGTVLELERANDGVLLIATSPNDQLLLRLSTFNGLELRAPIETTNRVTANTVAVRRTLTASLVTTSALEVNESTATRLLNAERVTATTFESATLQTKMLEAASVSATDVDTASIIAERASLTAGHFGLATFDNEGITLHGKLTIESGGLEVKAGILDGLLSSSSHVSPEQEVDERPRHLRVNPANECACLAHDAHNDIAPLSSSSKALRVVQDLSNVIEEDVAVIIVDGEPRLAARVRGEWIVQRQQQPSGCHLDQDNEPMVAEALRASVDAKGHSLKHARIEDASLVEARTVKAETVMLSGASDGVVSSHRGNLSTSVGDARFARVHAQSFEADEAIVNNGSASLELLRLPPRSSHDEVGHFLKIDDRKGTVGLASAVRQVEDGVVVDSDLLVQGAVVGRGPYVDSSDVRLKTDVKDFHLNLQDFKRLRPVTFSSHNTSSLGFLAQDILQLDSLKLLVHHHHHHHLGLAYARFVPVLVKAIHAILDALHL
mmetsp:Transcript_6254/g.18951  ORF Transcript_6254/g.18951 Transcript_6254/m.18951 type:complete len:698 (+) Transcript_6254:40-2133(+)